MFKVVRKQQLKILKNIKHSLRIQKKKNGFDRNTMAMVPKIFLLKNI